MHLQHHEKIYVNNCPDTLELGQNFTEALLVLPWHLSFLRKNAGTHTPNQYPVDVSRNITPVSADRVENNTFTGWCHHISGHYLFYYLYICPLNCILNAEVITALTY